MDKYICRECGKEIKYVGRQLYRRKHSHLGTDICFECARKNASTKSGKALKKLWGTPEYRNRQVMVHKKFAEKQSLNNPSYYKDLSNKFWSDPDKIKSRNINLSIALKKYYAGLSDDELYKKVKPLLDGLQNYWDNISDEELEIRTKNGKMILDKYYENETDEQRRNRLHKMSLSMIRYWKNMSIDDKNDLCDKIKKGHDKWLNSLSEEERCEYSNNIRMGFRKWWNSLSDEQIHQWNNLMKQYQRESSKNLTKTEAEFINLMKLYKMKFQYQYKNEIVDKYFIEEDVVNPVTGSTKVSPYHKWDFKVDIQNKSILVDIDGPIHAIPPFVKVLNGIDIGLYTQFNDSKRPYQTDGLDAYIVQAYNNKITDDTPVYSIKNSETMTFKAFMSIITFGIYSD